MARKNAWKTQMDSLSSFSKVNYYPEIAGVNVIEAFRSVEPKPYPSLPPECLEDPPHPESMVFFFFWLMICYNILYACVYLFIFHIVLCYRHLNIFLIIFRLILRAFFEVRVYGIFFWLIICYNIYMHVYIYLFFILSYVTDI